MSDSHEKFYFENFDQSLEEWEYYIQRFEIALQLSGIDGKAEQKRKQLLLSRIGPTPFKVLVDYYRPTPIQTKTYDELIKVLNDFYGKKSYILADRLAFSTKIRDSNKTISQFVLELRTLAGYWEFGNTLDERLRDQIVIGINNKKWQQELIREHPTNTSKLSEVIATAQKLELAANQSERITNLNLPQLSGSNNDEITVNNVTDRTKSNFGRNTNKKCVFCGKGFHKNLEQCPARGRKCSSCGKQNHFSSVCITTGKSKLKRFKTRFVNSNSENIQSNDEASDDDSIHTFRINSKKLASKIMISTKLNNNEIEMLYDPGAVHSVIGENIWKAIGRPALKSCKNLIAYTDVQIETLGKCPVTVEAFNKCKTLNIYVTKGNDIPLFGLDWCLLFKLPMPPGAKICNMKHENATKKDKSLKPNTTCNGMDLDHILAEYKTLFDGKLGTIEGHCAKIHIPNDVKPKTFRPRPVPLALQNQVNQELQRLVEQGVLEPVDTMTTPIEWASPIVIAVKANGNIRICADFKVTINRFVQTDDYPLPRFEEITSKLAGGQLFSKIDLKDAYLQLMVHPDSRKYLTISTHKGYFQYKRLPFGISFAPSLFQRIMHQLLSGLDGVVCYLDDILVTAPSIHEHTKRVRAVLERLKKAGVKSQVNKCAWFQNSVTFLGHTIDRHGLHPTTERIEAIQKMPIPSNVTELRSFLGSITYYGRFIDKLHVRCSPLYRLLKKGQKWIWTNDDTAIVNELKHILTSTDTLAHYNADLPIYLSSDASDKGLGAVLFHKLENNAMKPIAYASRTLSEVEKRYSTIDKEALGIIYGVTKFHQYIYGRKFVLLTDHKPLERIFSQDRETPKVASNRLLRWAMVLNSYNYTINYQPAKQNSPADALSRLPLPDTKLKPEERIGFPEFAHLLHLRLREIPITKKTLQQQTLKDPILSKIKTFISTHWPEKKKLNQELHTFYEKRQQMSFEDGIVLWNGRLCIPQQLQHDILKMLHDGHSGINAMQSVARLHVYWPNIDTDIVEFSKRCKCCQSTRKNHNLSPVYSWGVPPEQWYRIHIDFAGPIFGYTWLIVVDAYTKWIETIPMKSTTTEATISKLERIFATYGVPRYIVSDNGPQFISQEFKTYCKRIGVYHIRTTPYHPRTNGLAERTVRTFKERMLAAENGNITLDERLNAFLRAYRNSPRRSTGQTPYEMMFGRNMRTTFDIWKPSITDTLEKNRLKQQFQPTSKVKIPPEYQEGDTVWVNKPIEKGSEPGVVTQQTGPYSYKVKITNGEEKRKHADQLRPRRNSIFDEKNLSYFKKSNSTSVNNETTQITSQETAVLNTNETQQGHNVPSIPGPSSSSTAEPATLRRSERTAKPPSRFGFGLF